METKTEKMEWSKPILEELGKARYSLGSFTNGDTGYIILGCRDGNQPDTSVYLFDGISYGTCPSYD